MFNSIATGVVESINDHTAFTSNNVSDYILSRCGRAFFCAVAAGLVFVGPLRRIGGGRAVEFEFHPDWKFTQGERDNAIQAASMTMTGHHRVRAPNTFNDTDTFDHWSLPGHRASSSNGAGERVSQDVSPRRHRSRGKKVFLEFRGRAAGGGSFI